MRKIKKKPTKKRRPKKIIKVARLRSRPGVDKFRDHRGAGGLIRVLHREDGSNFAEFAIYLKRKNDDIVKALRYGGFKNEEKRKWVLRTDKFNVFVYF